MLKLVPNPTFKAKVKIPAPGGEEHEITLEFKHRTKSDMDALFVSDEWKKGNDVDNVLKLVVNWEGVDTPFSREALGMLFEHYHSAPARIASAYVVELAQARLGN